LTHFARIHSSRSDENREMSVNLSGSTFCGHQFPEPLQPLLGDG